MGGKGPAELRRGDSSCSLALGDRLQFGASTASSPTLAARAQIVQGLQARPLGPAAKEPPQPGQALPLPLEPPLRPPGNRAGCPSLKPPSAPTASRPGLCSSLPQASGHKLRALEQSRRRNSLESFPTAPAAPMKPPPPPGQESHGYPPTPYAPGDTFRTETAFHR